MKLNLGCGQNRLDGYINIDKFAAASPDLLWDLEQTPYPFEANSVTEIAAFHVLEHLGQDSSVFLRVIKELHRILAPGGIIEIKAPHFRSDGYWSDPTHVRPITQHVMNLFSKKLCRMFAERGWPNTPLADYLDVDLEIVKYSYALMPYWDECVRRKEITDTDLDQVIDTQWNVINEISITIQKV